MKKIVLILFLASVQFFGQVISFESSDGYSVGNIDGQQGWTTTTAHGDITEKQVITEEEASEGRQSFKIVKDDAIEQKQYPQVGGFYNVSPTIPVSNFKISFDVFFNEIGPNIYALNPANLGSGKYVALVYVSDYGELQTYNAQYFIGTGFVFTAKKWYSIAYEVTSEGLDVYVDGEKISTSKILDYGVVDQIRLMHTNAGGSAYIDNIRFGNEATFAVGDIAANDDLKVYPNPVKDFLSIDVPSTERVKSVSIFSVDGRSSVLTFDNNKADFSNLPAGVYVLQVETDSQTYTKKVIKK